MPNELNRRRFRAAIKKSFSKQKLDKLTDKIISNRERWWSIFLRALAELDVERLLAIERTKVKTDGAFAPTLLGALGGIRAIPGFGLASCEVCVLCRWNSPSIFSARRTTWYGLHIHGTDATYTVLTSARDQYYGPVWFQQVIFRLDYMVDSASPLTRGSILAKIIASSEIR